MSAFLVLTAALLLVATVLPLSVRRDWWIRAMDFPRLQIACLCVLWLLIAIFQARYTSAAVALSTGVVLLVLIYQCLWIWPYTQFHAVEVESHLLKPEISPAKIKIISCNVLMTNRNADPLKQLIERHQPDIFITLETDQWWQDQLDSLENYPHRLACALDNLYGMHVYSRLELQQPEIKFRVEADKPSMCMTVKVDASNELVLHVLHPAPPAPGENDESTERDVELLMLADTLSDKPIPTIIAGDLNDVAWSATTRLFRQLSGLLDPRVGRGFYNTFNANYRLIRWPLDHVFVSSHFRLLDLQRLPDVGSDHYPLLVELLMTPPDTQSANSVVDEPLDTERLDDILDSDTAQTAVT